LAIFESAMSIQLPLPARWATVQTLADPHDRLNVLKRDVAEAKDAIRAAMQELARRYRIQDNDVEYALEGYADDMLSDLIFYVERDLDREIEGEQER